MHKSQKKIYLCTTKKERIDITINTVFKKMHHLQRLFLAVMLVFTASTAMAQYYSGDHTFDGTNKNEASASLTTGDNIITGHCVGNTIHYKHYFNDHWSVDGGANLQYTKQLYGFKAKGEYHLKIRSFHMFASAEYMFNHYHKYNTNENVGNASVRFERGYWDITLGGSFIGYNMMGDHYTEPITLTFGAHATLRPRTNKWNVGLLFRNYDDFYYENWNINWGLDLYYRIKPNMKLFGEFNVRPAGSMSQLASKYETTGKIGVIYRWK